MLGLNFSHRQSTRLGLDPDEAFYAVLIHLKPPLLRLSLYWDELSPAPGAYDFSMTRAILDRAQQQGCRVLLTLGFKPQRHPDFFPPRWLAESGSRSLPLPGLGEGGSPSLPLPGLGEGRGEGIGEGRLAANLLMMLERAVALLADYDAIDAWEVEHLPFLPANQQPPGWSIGRGLLAREIGVVRDVDPRHRPVVVSHPGGRIFERGWREALFAADVLGCTLPVVAAPAAALPRLRAATFSRTRAMQLAAQAALAARFGRQLWVTELVDESQDEPYRSSAIPDPARDARLATRAGAVRCYLRGVEEWLLMRYRGRPERWEQARALFRQAAEPGR